MIQSITTAGIGNPGSLEELIALAGQYGFGGVDAGGNQLIQLIQERGVEGALDLLAKHHVQIASIGLPVEWRTDEASFQQGLATLAAHAEAAAALGVTACTTYLLPSVDDETARYTSRAIRRLRLCAQILEGYGMKLGLEFVGPHHLRTHWENLFIYDIPGLMEMIEAIDRPNVGILLDSIHWYTTGGTVEDILALPSSKIVHVHINDAPDVPVEEVLDNGRLYPGEGVIDLTSFLQALREIGYTGFISQEILTQEPPQGTPEELIQKTRRCYDQVFAK